MQVVVVTPAYEVPPGGIYLNNDMIKHSKCNTELHKFSNAINLFRSFSL